MRSRGEGVVMAERFSATKRGLLRQFIHWLDSKARSREELIALCLERIAARDAQLKAWVEVSPQPELNRGPLTGIPFGAKDIFETLNLATEYGSPLYAGRKGSSDAALVAQLRELGGVLLGKTQTTAFAYFDPAPTRNPHDPARTPGGSSSGSAVAVAAGMVPFALGKQTLGSIIRPASFCGVVGFKPTHGTLSLDGVLPFAPSLDTAGLFTQTADDMRLLWTRLGNKNAMPKPWLGVPTLMPPVEPQMESAFRTTVERLALSYQVNILELPTDFCELTGAARLIAAYEGSRTHAPRHREHGDQIGRKLAQLVDEGLRIPVSQYHAALALIADVKRETRRLFHEYPFLLTPAAPGPAPEGLESTGDPVMNCAWTALGFPVISVPMSAHNGLPMGLQIVADLGCDSELVTLAVHIESTLND